MFISCGYYSTAIGYNAIAYGHNCVQLGQGTNTQANTLQFKNYQLVDENGKNSELIQMLKMVAPGTNLREGLDNILKARTGALIVIGDSAEVVSS